MPIEWTEVVFGGAFCFFGLTQTILLYYIILGSQKVVDENEVLMDKIENARIIEKWSNDCATLNYGLKRLQAFQGFSGGDYFYLNKPLITGIAANFVTYFIVLVQFRI